MKEILLLSGIAGVLGTGLGGVVGLIFAKRSERTVSRLLAFAAGVMLSIVFFDLIPEAITLSNVYMCVASVIGGVALVYLLNYLIDTLTNLKEVHTSPEEIHHQEELVSPDRTRSMFTSGLVMFCAIALHNLPEGMAIGSGSEHDNRMGLMLAILIALHNIPEGISIGVPLMEGGMKRWKAVLLTAISGAPTFIGGLLGAMLGGISETITGVTLAVAGGAMMYVTFCEILPQATLMDRSRRPAVYSVTGVLFGLIMVYALS